VRMPSAGLSAVHGVSSAGVCATYGAPSAWVERRVVGARHVWPTDEEIVHASTRLVTLEGRCIRRRYIARAHTK
jgi:hypothetical protein